MARTKKENLMEKLSALQPHVPTSTRVKKAAKAAPPEKKPAVKTEKAAGKKATVRKKTAPLPTARKVVEPPPLRIEAPSAPPPPRPAVQDKPAESAPPKPEKAVYPFEGLMSFPFTMLEFWNGCIRSCYRMAETQTNYFINMTCWRRKF